YQSTKLGSFSESQPAHSGRQPLELHFLLGFTNPSGEALVLRKSGENQFVDLANIFRISGQRSPSERSPALTKHWPDVSLDKSRKLKRVLQPSIQGTLSNIVPILEGDSPPSRHSNHCPHMFENTSSRLLQIILRIGSAQRIRLFL